MRVTGKLEIYFLSACHVRIIGSWTRTIVDSPLGIFLSVRSRSLCFSDTSSTPASQMRALTFKRHRYVPKHAHTVTLQCGGDEVWIGHNIVVA
jgi:hypothetical protein